MGGGGGGRVGVLHNDNDDADVTPFVALGLKTIVDAESFTIAGLKAGLWNDEEVEFISNGPAVLCEVSCESVSSLFNQLITATTAIGPSVFPISFKTSENVVLENKTWSLFCETMGYVQDLQSLVVSFAQILFLTGRSFLAKKKKKKIHFQMALQVDLIHS